MIDFLSEWAQLLLRWMHVLFAIAWIGHAFLFHSLEHGLRAPEVDGVDPDVEGELWMVHGGGFFRLQKTYKLPPVFTGALHWFKYEALGTWVTGFCLVVVLYYMKGVLMVDPRVADLSHLAAAGVGLGSLVLGWLAYDTLWHTMGKSQPKVATAITVLAVAGLGVGLTQLLSGRAAFLHMGAVLGTLMTANVWMRIIPGSKRMVAALEAGREHDPEDGRIGHQRSVHNGYMHFPIVFFMISNHYPAIYGHDLNWLMLLLFLAGGAFARQLFYDGMAAALPVKAVVFTSFLGVLGLTFPWQDFRAEEPVVVDDGSGKAIDPATAGTIEGRVRYTGDVPEPVELNLYGGCELEISGPVLEQRVKVKDQALAEAFVTVVSDFEGWRIPPPPEEPVEVDQRGCVYVPLVFGAQVGQEVVFINSDPMFHNIRTDSSDNPSFILNFPAKDQRESKVFRRPERMISARCDVHPWMVSHLGVVGHPWFAITDADGRFSLPGLPPGTYEVEVWHEVLGTKRAQATVSEKGTATLEFVFDAIPKE